MDDLEAFRGLIERVRAGDQAAAVELVRAYEPAVRRLVRFRLKDARLRRSFDSMDVCQSVLASFFHRAARGDYELEGPEDLVKLLARMARNKLASAVKREQADRRDHRRVAAAGDGVAVLAGGDPSVSREVAARELLREARARLTAEEWQLFELREAGRPWDEIGAELGQSPGALRMRLSRALGRIAQDLDREV